MKRKIILSIAIFIFVLLVGGLVYSKIENWRYLDSVYFVVLTATTVGYGDFAPKTDAGKIFTIFFSFVGIGMAFYFFSLAGRYMLKKQLKSELKKSEKLIFAKKTIRT